MEGQSRCALDYEAEISLQSSCPAQFIKGGGGGGVCEYRGGGGRLGVCGGGISVSDSVRRPLFLPPLPAMVRSGVCEFVALSGFW